MNKQGRRSVPRQRCCTAFNPKKVLQRFWFATVQDLERINDYVREYLRPFSSASMCRFHLVAVANEMSQWFASTATPTSLHLDAP